MYTRVQKCTQRYTKVHQGTIMYIKEHKSTPGKKKYIRVQKCPQRYTKLHQGTQMYTRVHKCTNRYTKVHKCKKNTQKFKGYLKVQKGTKLLIFPTVYYMLTTLLLYEGLQSSSKIGKFHFIIRTVERSRETESCTLES